MATEIINPMQVPPPSAPAGSQRVRSRDAMGGSPAPLGPNYTELPVPGRKIITKKNKLELKSGHMNMLSRMTKGNPWQQHRQLQMLRGMYKTTMCKHEPRGCEKGDACVFARAADNEAKIDAEVIPLRLFVYTSCSRIDSRCLLRFYMRSARSLKKSIRSLCGRRPTTRIWWTSRPPGRRRLALKDLGCTTILGPQGVFPAIAIVGPRTQIAGPKFLAPQRPTTSLRGLVRVRVGAAPRPRWRSTTTTPALSSEI